MWSINPARDLAISELSRTAMQTMDRIILGKAYAVDEWVLTGYTEIAKRDRPISSEEGKVLGGVTVALLSQVREAAYKRANTSPVHSFASVRLRTMLNQQDTAARIILPDHENYGYARHIQQLFGSELTEKNAETSWNHSVALLSVQEMLAIVHDKPRGVTRHAQFYLESIIFQVSQATDLHSITP